MNNILCVIPARSGSREIKDKNIKKFVNKPLLVHTIKYAEKCNLISKTIVSTDSVKYAEIARNYGAEVPFIRPEKFSLDSSQDIDFIYHALVNCEKLYNRKFEFTILLRPTSPVRPNGIIEKGLELMVNDPLASSLKAVTVSNEHPYRQWVSEGKYIEGYEKSLYEPYNLPRQKLPTVYYSAGDLEIIRRDTIISGSVSGEKIIPLILEKNQVVDIDSEKDWKNAEELYIKLNK